MPVTKRCRGCDQVLPMEQFYRDRDRAEARVTTRRSGGAGTSAEAAITDISYDVRPGPRTSIVIDGFTVPRRVIDSIRTAWSHAVIDEFLIDEAQAIVRGELVDRGFVEASVSATVGGTGTRERLSTSFSCSSPPKTTYSRFGTVTVPV